MEEKRTSFSLAESLCKSHIVYKIHIPDIFFKVSRFNNKASNNGCVGGGHSKDSGRSFTEEHRVYK